jgi:GTPase SAR1 family protein
MGILLVYDVTDEASFNNVRNWMKNIETHASSTVNKVTPVCAGWAAAVLASSLESLVDHTAIIVTTLRCPALDTC